MKRAYGVFNYINKKDIELYESLSPFERASNLWNAIGPMCATLPQLVEQFSAVKVAIALEKKAKDGNCKHFFFSGDGFHDWLAGCKTPLSEEQESIVGGFKDGCGTPFMLHFVKGDSPVYLCAWSDIFDPLTQQKRDGRVLFVSKGIKNHCYWFCPNGSEEGNSDKDTLETRAVVSSAMAYIQAFPEMVTDGIPEDLKHPNYYRLSTSSTVGVSPKLVVRDGPCPHYRMGHFRMLTSERFTHKRGQVVFVHGCFVKGKAETVLSLEESSRES